MKNIDVLFANLTSEEIVEILSKVDYGYIYCEDWRKIPSHKEFVDMLQRELNAGNKIGLVRSGDFNATIVSNGKSLDYYLAITHILPSIFQLLRNLQIDRILS